MWNVTREMRRLMVPGVMMLASLQGFGQASVKVTKTVTETPQAATEGNFPATQEQLLKLLRLSPTLTEVVARDPSLLSDQEYVNRNNPELGQFLVTHPEVARNPGFYLFTHLPPGQGSNEEALERKVWPDFGRPAQTRGHLEFLVNEVGPFFVILTIVGSLIWLIRTLLENRRWSRAFKLQTEVHGRLIERFGTSQELLTYMETDAGSRFLKAAPIPVGPEPNQAMPNAVARILTSLQVGAILSLVGIGFYLMRHNDPEFTSLCELLAVFTLMPGIGCILSAAATWVLAGRLGLMPAGQAAQNHTPLDRQ